MLLLGSLHPVVPVEERTIGLDQRVGGLPETRVSSWRPAVTSGRSNHAGCGGAAQRAGPSLAGQGRLRRRTR